jgi:hypothetical protein
MFKVSWKYQERGKGGYEKADWLLFPDVDYRITDLHDFR